MATSLESDSNIHTADSDGNTPLHLASSRGDGSVIRTLLRNGALIGSKNNRDETSLHQAVSNGHDSVLDILLEEGADLHSKNDDGDTPLHFAASKGDSSILKTLLQNGALIESKNRKDETPLHQAVSNGHDSVLDILLEFDANLQSKNVEGDTPLHLASKSGFLRVAKHLLEKGADLENQNKGKHTPLHLATIEGNVPMMKLMLELDANVYNINYTKNTGAHHAAFNGRWEVMKTLLDHGFNVNYPNNNTKCTMLHLAAREGHFESVSCLIEIEYGANPNVYTNKGDTPATMAARLGYTDIVIKLIKAGGSLKNDENGPSVLHAAAKGGRLHTIQELVQRYQKKIDLHAKWNMLTPQAVSSAAGSRNCNWWLWKQIEDKHPADLGMMSNGHVQDYSKRIYEDSGSNIIYRSTIPTERETTWIRKNIEDGEIELHYMDEFGNTMLHTAIENKNTETVKVLVKAGALVIAKNYQGLTPLDIAERNGLSLQDIVDFQLNTKAVAHQLQYENKFLLLEGAREHSASELISVLKQCVEKLTQELDGEKPWEAQFKNPQCVEKLTQELDGEKPWEAQFKNPHHISLTRLYVTACRCGATVTAWYIWRAGASNYIPETPSGCTALEAALSAGHTSTAVRLVMDMDANPFLKDSKEKVLLDSFPEDSLSLLLDLMLGREYRSLSKKVEKAKDNRDKKDFQQVILLFMVLFLQHKLGNDMDVWKTIFDFISKAHSYISKKGMLEQGEWLEVLENFLVQDGVDGVKLKQPVEHGVSVDNSGVVHDTGNSMNTCVPPSINETDPFCILLFNLQENFLSFGNQYTDVLKYKALFKKAFRISCENQLPLFMHLLVSLAKCDIKLELNEVCNTRPLHHVAKNGNSSGTTYLLQCGASPYDKDRSAILPVQYAFMYGHRSTGDILISCMKQTRAVTSFVESVMHNHETYLKHYKLNPEKNDYSRYLHVENYDKMLTNRFNWIRNEWQGKGIKRAVDDILVDYQCTEAREVKYSVFSFMSTLTNEISRKDQDFEGDVKFVGSSEDNVRLYCPDEYDCNLVLKRFTGYPDGKFIATLRTLDKEEANLKGHRKILEVQRRVETDESINERSNFLDKFYNIARECLIEMDLKEDRLKLMLPGIRHTQVGIALSFLWSGTDYPMLFVDVDFVPIVRAPWLDGLEKPECSLDICHFQEVHLNVIGEGEWRLSFGLLETQIMKNLSPDKRYVFLACKMILAALKTEGWVPKKLKCNYTYWESKMFSIPAKGGFALKNCFFQEIEEIKDDKNWKSKNILTRVRSVFERMCEIDKISSEGQGQESYAPKRWSKPVKAYFGEETEKASIFSVAPEILKFLGSLDVPVVNVSTVLLYVTLLSLLITFCLFHVVY